MSDKKIVLQFIALTFVIAYATSGILIVLGHFGYRVYGLVHSFRQFAANIPFAIYILSPAIASYIILKNNKKISGVQEWLKTVFCIKSKSFVYFAIFAVLVLYFGINIAVSGHVGMALPFYMFFLSLPGNLFIGGLEEAGWTYVLQPRMDQKYGFLLSSVLVGIIWIFWHVPLFFIPGTAHCEGTIDFWMFNVQVISLSFFRGAIYRIGKDFLPISPAIPRVTHGKAVRCPLTVGCPHVCPSKLAHPCGRPPGLSHKISEKGYVFPFMLFHTMFNSASSLFGSTTMTWSGTITANTAMILISILIVSVYGRTQRLKMWLKK